jgi:hypothetical protein
MITRVLDDRCLRLLIIDRNGKRGISSDTRGICVPIDALCKAEKRRVNTQLKGSRDSHHQGRATYERSPTPPSPAG